MNTFTLHNKFDDTFDAGEAFTSLEDARAWFCSPHEKYEPTDLYILEIDADGQVVAEHAYDA